MKSNKPRQFEIPYNFDPQLIETLFILDDVNNSFVNCIYLPPYLYDYQTILRNPEQANNLSHMSRKDYEKHLTLINTKFPNKIQLLLQNPNIILDKQSIEYYNQLGINKFCSGSGQQSQIIRSTIPDSNIIGSISMKITKEDILKHPEYKELFDGFVLHFPYSKNIKLLQEMPNQFYYLILINAFCNVHCIGTNHWFNSYKPGADEIHCPGLYDGQKVKWNDTALVRPMDLDIFDPYIKIFKLQDRGWPTNDIIRDIVLYTTDYSLYPNIVPDFSLYL